MTDEAEQNNTRQYGNYSFGGNNPVRNENTQNNGNQRVRFYDDQQLSQRPQQSYNRFENSRNQGYQSDNRNQSGNNRSDWRYDRGGNNQGYQPWRTRSQPPENQQRDKNEGNSGNNENNNGNRGNQDSQRTAESKNVQTHPPST